MGAKEGNVNYCVAKSGKSMASLPPAVEPPYILLALDVLSHTQTDRALPLQDHLTGGWNSRPHRRSCPRTETR